MGHHPDLAAGPEAAFRLLLSHTPDNFPWAQEQGVELMLAGHNHGGQIVFPIIGPLVFAQPLRRALRRRLLVREGHAAPRVAGFVGRSSAPL